MRISDWSSDVCSSDLSTGIGTFVDLTVGAFYTNEKSNRDSEIIYRDPGSGAVIPDLFILSTPSKYDEYAAFGNMTLKITDKFDVTGGLRVARNEQSYSQTGVGFDGDRQYGRASWRERGWK